MLIEFPVELPEDLLEELDCAESDTQFAAFCVDMGHEKGVALERRQHQIVPKRLGFYGAVVLPSPCRVEQEEQSAALAMASIGSFTITATACPMWPTTIRRGDVLKRKRCPR